MTVVDASSSEQVRRASWEEVFLVVATLARGAMPVPDDVARVALPDIGGPRVEDVLSISFRDAADARQWMEQLVSVVPLHQDRWEVAAAGLFAPLGWRAFVYGGPRR